MSERRPDWWPTPSSEAATRVMLGNRRVDTKPETLVRRELHRRGMRYRVDHTLRHSGTWTRPDVVFTRWKVAVYVDGCFWHGCPLHGTKPTANRGYWSSKILRNRTRDRRTGLALREMGWCVLRFWEHTPPEQVADVVETVLDNRRRAAAGGSVLGSVRRARAAVPRRS